MKKRILALFLTTTLVMACAVPVLADRQSDLEAQRAANSSALNTAKAEIAQREEAINILDQEIADLDDQLVTLISNIEILKGDIQRTRDDIATKTTELADAEVRKDDQYAAMTSRIQYIYENGDGSSWLSYILKAEDLADLLNRADYTQQMHKYDRDMLEDFKATIVEIQDIKANLEMNEAQLEEEEKNLEQQQVELNEKLDEKRADSANYASEISALNKKADQLTGEIRKANEEIARIEAEKAEAARREAEEAARKAAEEEARRQAEADRNKQAQQETQQQEQAQQPSAPQPQPEQPSTPAPQPEQSVGDSSGSSAGRAVVSFAMNFIGGPYKWGGESLTEGADCSGFVKAVYANFGIGLPHSSAALAGVGVPVSMNDIQPGDIVCYSGHVGIYAGNNTLVHASNEITGITTTSPITYRTIVAIRRVV
ncbi:MAG: NlpC/P60 family protein [Lachnospiraceae bacterium]|nr:NlpC/P60 family protein [Lachnospiraceae bacterium]